MHTTVCGSTCGAARKTKKVSWLLAIHVSIMGLLISYYLALDTKGNWFESHVYTLCVMLCASCIWCLWTWYACTGSLFDPYAIFFLMAMLFNGGHAFLEVLNLNKGQILGEIFSTETVLRSLILVALGLTSFHLGALIRSLLISRQSRPRLATDSSVRRRAMRSVGWWLLMISIIPFVIYAYRSIRVTSSAGYLAMYERPFGPGWEAGVYILSCYTISAAIFLLLGSDNRVDKITSLVTLASYTMVYLIMGFRIWALTPLVAFIWVYHRCVRRMSSLFLICSGIVLLFVIIPIVGTSRNISGTTKYSPSSMIDNYLSIGNPIVHEIQEMGNTLAIVSYSLDLIPDKYDYYYGSGYAYSLMQTVPNLFWSTHPANKAKYGDWLMLEINPKGAVKGEGMGFSFIAEAYVNFGWYGSIVALAIIGFGLSSFYYWATLSGDRLKIAALACFMCHMTWYARGSTVELIRPLVWYTLVPYLLATLLSRYHSMRLCFKQSTSR